MEIKQTSIFEQLSKTDIDTLLKNVAKMSYPFCKKGNVNDFIPALSNVSPNKFGITLRRIDGECFNIGDTNEKFSIQSISKVIVLAMVLKIDSQSLWSRIGKSPSNARFDDIAQLQFDKGIPGHPFLNSGALVLIDILLEHSQDPIEIILNTMREISGINRININAAVFQSEMETAVRNRAIGYYLKSHGNLKHPVETVLDIYCQICAIEMTCIELCEVFAVFARDGLSITNKNFLPRESIEQTNQLMQTCGFYGAGLEYSSRVGMPGKSGSGGGIVAVLPGALSLAIWSPALDCDGTSIAGMYALNSLASSLRISSSP